MNTEKDLRDTVLSKAGSDERFRDLLICDPKEAVRDAFGVNIPDSISVHVYEDSGSDVHLVLPCSDRLTEQELDAVSGGNAWRSW